MRLVAIGNLCSGCFASRAAPHVRHCRDHRVRSAGHAQAAAFRARTAVLAHRHRRQINPTAKARRMAQTARRLVHPNRNARDRGPDHRPRRQRRKRKHTHSRQGKRHQHRQRAELGLADPRRRRAANLANHTSNAIAGLRPGSCLCPSICSACAARHITLCRFRPHDNSPSLTAAKIR